MLHREFYFLPSTTLYHFRKTLIRPENFWDVKMLPCFRLLGTLTAPPSEITNTPRGHPCNLAMHMETTPNRPKPGTHDAAAPAQIVTTLDDAPPVCMAWTTPRTGPADAGGTTAGPTMEPTTGPTQAAGDGHRPAGRTIAGTDAQPVRGGAQSRTEDAQPQPVRITEDTSIHLSL